MFMSLIICTRNRALQLKECLNEIAVASVPPCEFEIVLVDNGSEDLTGSIITDFKNASSLNVTLVNCAKIGLSAARNAGISASKGDWLLFTDDDCYVERAFFVNFFKFVQSLAGSSDNTKEIKYGSGPILPYDNQHDPRIAKLEITKTVLMPRGSIFPAGTVQGANMFFHRSIFDRVGYFDGKVGHAAPPLCV